MFVKLVVVALCVLSSTGHQWNQRQYETVLKKGLPQVSMTARKEVKINSGQCTGLYYTDALCNSDQVISAVKVTVIDSQPYADIMIDNQLSVVRISRSNVLGYCYDTAQILIEGSCPVTQAYN